LNYVPTLIDDHLTTDIFWHKLHQNINT